MNILRRIIILSHRYLGIAISLLVISWFASGIVMMYAGGMPGVTAQTRLNRLPDLDMSRVRLSPGEAAERAAAAEAGIPGRLRGGRAQLLTVMDRPAYRVGAVTVFADSGDVLEELSIPEAQRVASRFTGNPEDRVRYVETLTSIDQWTIGQGRNLPLYKFLVDDADGTEVYVQPTTADVAMLTTRRSRALAWVGVIPHWLYFSALRADQPLWYDIVVWTSAAACVLSVLGLFLAVLQWRKTRPFRLAKSIPFTGWMRWHYITGAVFGVFTLTWAFSGLLSMEPFAWTNAAGLEISRDALTGGRPDLSRFGTVAPAEWDRVLAGRAIKDIEFSRIQDEHYYVIRLAPLDAAAAQRRERLHQPYPVAGRAEPDRVLVQADSMEVRRQPFSTDSLLARLRADVPDELIVASELLGEYDSYYYSRGRQAPLPVLRVKFGDPAETWVYLDPEMSQVLASIHRLNRVERWLYNGLHSLDFSFWYDRRPLWDIGMITLLLGGLATSGLGLVMGLKRLRRGAVRIATTGARAVSAPAVAPRTSLDA